MDEDRAAISTRLHRAALRSAGRLGTLLADLPLEHDAAGFLRGLCDDGPHAPLLEGAAPHPVDHLVRLLDLDDVDVALLLLAGLSEEHEGVAAALRGLHPAGRPAVTTGLAAALLDAGLLGGKPEGEPARVWLRRRLGTGPLADAGVVEIGDGSFWEADLLLAEGLWGVLHGAPGWPGGAVEVDPALIGLIPPGLSTDDPSLRAGMLAVARGVPATVVLAGEDPAGAALRFATLARGTGAVPAVLGIDTLDRRTARGVALAALARDTLPILVPEHVPEGTALVDDLPTPVVLALRPADHRGTLVPRHRPTLRVEVPALTAGQRSELWRRLVPGWDDPTAVAPSLDPCQAAAVARDAALSALLRGAETSGGDIRAAAATRSRDLLPAGVVRLRPTAGWSDVVLPTDRLAQLHDAVVRVRRADVVFDRWGLLRGRPGRRGVRLLFHGPPGTGKTLAAEVLAAAVGRDLLVVDLSQMVSKWIGETEKNLAEAFDAAERGEAVLLFDEADALFGRRTEVGDARDRYANLETAYLLSRLAVFEGVAVLATNLRQNIDPAFARRLEFIVPFDLPGEPERRRLWHRHLPADAPAADDVDLGELAALYPISGALIRNAVVAGAFAAADARAPIRQSDLVAAVRREYAKSGQAFPGPPPSLGAPSLPAAAGEESSCRPRPR